MLILLYLEQQAWKERVSVQLMSLSLCLGDLKLSVPQSLHP